MSVCSRCGAVFECGMADRGASTEPCWCTRMPVLPVEAYVRNGEDSAAGSCFCPECLRGLIAATQNSQDAG